MTGCLEYQSDHHEVQDVKYFNPTFSSGNFARIPLSISSVLGTASCKQPTCFIGDGSRSVLDDELVISSLHHNSSHCTDAVKEAVKLLVVF